MAPSQVGLAVLGALWFLLSWRRQRAVQTLQLGDKAAASHLDGPLAIREIVAMFVVPTAAGLSLLFLPPAEALAVVSARWFHLVILLGVLAMWTEAAGLRQASKAALQAAAGDPGLSRTKIGAKGADRVLCSSPWPFSGWPWANRPSSLPSATIR